MDDDAKSLARISSFYTHLPLCLDGVTAPAKASHAEAMSVYGTEGMVIKMGAICKSLDAVGLMVFSRRIKFSSHPFYNYQCEGGTLITCDRLGETGHVEMGGIVGYQYLLVIVAEGFAQVSSSVACPKPARALKEVFEEKKTKDLRKKNAQSSKINERRSALLSSVYNKIVDHM